MKRSFVFVAAVFSALALQSAVQAQYPITVVDPVTGQPTHLHASRFQPGANIQLPGTGQFWVDPVTGAAGYRYLGADGQWHGNTSITNPFTGQTETHVYGKRTSQPSSSTPYRPSYPSSTPAYRPAQPTYPSSSSGYRPVPYRR